MASDQDFLSPNRTETKSWGKLTSVNPNHPNIDLINKAYKIGRNSTNDIVIQDARMSGNHCILSQADNGAVMLMDLSSNGTFVEGQKIGKGKSRALLPGNKFYLLPATKVKEGDLLGYVFSSSPYDLNPLKRPRDQAQDKPAEVNKQTKPQDKPAAEANKQPKAPEMSLEDEKKLIHCEACGKCAYQCVTTRPCNHNFCGACYFEAVGINALCPKCFVELSSLKRNNQIDERVRKFVERNPQYVRPANEMNRENPYQKDHIFKKDTISTSQEQREQDQKEQQEAAREIQQHREQKNNAAPSMRTRKEPNITENMDLEDVGPSDADAPLSKVQKYYMLMSRFTAE